MNRGREGIPTKSPRAKVHSATRLLCLVLFFALSSQSVACAANMGAPKKGKDPVQQRAIDAVLEQHNDQLMALPGVVGTAVGKCAERPCIKILVVKKTPELLKRVPQTLEGFPVVVEETGEFRPLRSS